MAPHNTHISDDFVNSVLDCTALADVPMLAFRDPDAFPAGNLHHSFEHWECFTRFAPCDVANTVLDWIKNFVNIYDFFNLLKGSLKGNLSILKFPRLRFFLITPPV